MQDSSLFNLQYIWLHCDLTTACCSHNAASPWATKRGSRTDGPPRNSCNKASPLDM